MKTIITLVCLFSPLFLFAETITLEPFPLPPAAAKEFGSTQNRTLIWQLTPQETIKFNEILEGGVDEMRPREFGSTKTFGISDKFKPIDASTLQNSVAVIPDNSTQATFNNSYTLSIHSKKLEKQEKLIEKLSDLVTSLAENIKVLNNKIEELNSER